MSTFLFTAKIFGHNHSCFYELDIYDNGGVAVVVTMEMDTDYQYPGSVDPSRVY